MADSILALPCLRGSIGDWNYYNIVLPFNEIDRINNDHIIKEAKSLDQWLQRKLSNRKENIKEYLLFENERFFNSVIIGVYGSVPDWYALNLEPVAKKHGLVLGKSIENSLGVLTLSGKEVLFTIDGQHRIEGIKLALNESPDRFKNDELSMTLIAHNKDKKGVIRTRKLFATINREAVKPSNNDLAIIDEVYAYNVIARDLYANYKHFKNKVALTETTDLDRANHIEFTNLLTLVEVNKKVLRLVKTYIQSKYLGPSLEDRKLLYKEAAAFWDFVIENIILYKNYFDNKNVLSDYRNAEYGKPHNLLFTPIGQKFLGEIYYTYKNQGKLEFLKSKINHIDFDLYTGHFKDIFFNPIKNTMIMNNQTFAKKFFLYLMGEQLDKGELKENFAKALGINQLTDQYSKLKLPEPL